MLTKIPALFPLSYEQSRDRFLHSFDFVQTLWANARRYRYPLSQFNDLSIDWIQADATQRAERVLIFTTGEHGIEGFVGSAMMQRFIEVYLPRLNPMDTGLLLVHAINPWGMQSKRRTNPNNVDLNRNFVADKISLDPSFNPGFGELEAIFNQNEHVQSYGTANVKFMIDLARHLKKESWEQLRATWLVGQYSHPKGIHYGGNLIQEETSVLKGLYHQEFNSYPQILHLDMHTGYGPRYQMSIVNSVHEKRPSDEWVRKFDYPLIVAANPEEFYAISGDMIDYIYTLRDRSFSGKRLYATSFEFGTFGEKITDRLRTLRAMVFENQMYWNGCVSARTKNRIKGEFEELFYPSEAKWRAKAVADADRAFEGILTAEGYVSAN